MGYEQRSPQPEVRQFGGLNTRDSEIALPGNDSPSMLNVSLHPAGSVQSREGMRALTSPTGEFKIDAIMSLQNPEEGRIFLYCIADGTIYRTTDPGVWSWLEAKIDGAPAESVVMPAVDHHYGRENTRYYDLDSTTEYPACLYICRTDGAPIVAVGAVDPDADLFEIPVGVAGIPGTPGTPGTPGYNPDWDGDMGFPKFIRLIGLGAGERLHAWGFEGNKSISYYSALDEPYNFIRAKMDYNLDANPEVDGGFYGVRLGDGDEIVTIVDMVSYTVIFKKNNTFLYTGDPGSTDWALKKTIPVGCVSDRAWVKVGDDILFWAKDGPRALSAVFEYGDLAHANVALKILDEVVGVIPDDFDKICCYHDPTNMRVIWYVPMLGNSYNNAAFVFYYDRGIFTRWSGGATNIMDVERVITDGSQTERIIAGGYDTGVVQLQYGDADVENIDDVITLDDIEKTYITGWIQTGSVADATRSLWVDFFFGDGGGGVDIEFQTDLNETWEPIDRITSSMGGSGSIWGSFKWGDGTKWGQTGRSFVRYEMDALFRLIRFRFSKTGQLGFETMGFRIEMRERGSRA